MKKFRLKNLHPLAHHEKQQGSKKSRLIGILTDVLKNIISQTEDQLHSQTPSIHHDYERSERVKTEQTLNGKSQKVENQRIEQECSLVQIHISNEAQIENQKSRALFKQQLDSRDYVLVHPFSFKVTLPVPTSQITQKQASDNEQAKLQRTSFTQTVQFQELCEMMDDFIVMVCENVISIGFNFLNGQKLLQSQSKDFASKNILLNVKSVISSIIQAVKTHKIAENNLELQQIKYNITKRADETLQEVLKNLADYYPQAPPTGGTPKMRAILASVNRMDDDEYDLILAHNIQVTQKEFQTHDYTEFIMKVLNKAIQVTGQIEDNDVRGRTLFQKFTQFSQNLFGITQRKQPTAKKGEEKKEREKQIAKYLEGVILGLDKQVKQGILESHLEADESISKMLENTADQIQKLKRNKSFSIGQKIPSFVKSFSKNDLKQKNLNVKNSSILRILTKWAEYLQQFFDKPEIVIKQRIYPFKTTENQPINCLKSIKDILYQQLVKSKQQVKEQLEMLQNDNILFQAQFLSKASNEKINSFVKRFSDTRETASKMNAVLIRFMVKYINILIDKLLFAGRSVSVDFQEKTINLVSFRIGDLMRARLQCTESGFISILKTLYALDELDNNKFFKLVRIKNKLDSKDNNVLINFMFMGKTQCQLQLSIQNLGGKQKNYYSFSHFIYELTRGKFGALTQCAIIVSQHDPKVSSSQGYFYKPRRKSKEEKTAQPKLQAQNMKGLKLQPQNQQKLQNPRNTLKNASNKKMFVCQECGELIFNQNIDLLSKKGDKENELIYICVNCTLKSSKDQNKTNQELISDQQTSLFLKKWVDKTLLLKLKNFDLSQCHEILGYRQVYLLRFDPSSGSPQLCCIWQYPNSSTYYLLKLNSAIPELDSDQKIRESVDYKDISKEVLSKAPTGEFTYIIWNFIDKQFRKELYDLLKITHQCIQTNNIFKYFLKQQSKARVIENFNSKNEILTVFQDSIQLEEIQKYFEGKNQDEINYTKQYIKKIYANYLQLTKVPQFLKNWSHLKVLSLANNQISQLDLAQKVELSQLYLSRNKLQAINLQHNPNLQIIYIGDNHLTEIKVDNLQKLRVLSLSSNQIKTISLEKNPLLTELNLIANQLTEINIESNRSLSILYLASNNISELNLQNNRKLSKINFYNNYLSEINLSNTSDLVWVRISQNQLSQIDISNNKKLWYLDLSVNAIKSINLRNLEKLQTAIFRLGQGAKLEDIILDGTNKKCDFSGIFDTQEQVRQLKKALQSKYPELSFG